MRKNMLSPEQDNKSLKFKDRNKIKTNLKKYEIYKN